MRRSIEFNQQYYADDHDMWMETQAQQNGYAYQQESWSSGNNFHNRFPAMNTNKHNASAWASDLSMSNKLRAKHMLGKGHGMFQEGMHREHGFGYGHGGGRKFNNFGGQRECFSEETEVMMVYEEGRVGGGSYQVDPYGRKMIRNINWWT